MKEFEKTLQATQVKINIKEKLEVVRTIEKPKENKAKPIFYWGDNGKEQYAGVPKSKGHKHIDGRRPTQTDTRRIESIGRSHERS